jgi:hypothetical protein|mmetsp:Transcript_11574/g.53842  ORF Transcript_11574/g.53842 Transcript_11574/m.53842 type:complete len:82 (-) Transcript_11574:1262-1507(-)
MVTLKINILKCRQGAAHDIWSQITPILSYMAVFSNIMPIVPHVNKYFIQIGWKYALEKFPIALGTKNKAQGSKRVRLNLKH